MTRNELIKILQKYPENTEIVLQSEDLNEEFAETVPSFTSNDVIYSKNNKRIILLKRALQDPIDCSSQE